ncbi:MAG: L-threonylcarbamoyladenylate synthase [Flavobacteriales bacterium]|nr:L-threonylcarbamoyladenylate synthase [Flavobacteriales bacterium]
MLIDIHQENPDERKIQQVVEVLKKGGVIIYPTDSVYSLGCALSHTKAIERVAQIKGIKPEKANFSIVCEDLSQLSRYAKQVDTNIYKLMKRALPGPYTFILNASNLVPKIFKSKKKTIGIRVPDHLIPQRIVEVLGEPIIATSVHADDEILEYITDPELIHEKYEKIVDLVVNSGMGNIHASTIFDCTSGEPELVREGIGPIEGLI